MDPEAIGRAMAEGTPHALALGFVFVSAEAGTGVLKVPWREDLVGDPQSGVLAGGVVTALLDHACGLAVASLGAAGSTATLDLRIDYMRPAEPRRDVFARAHCYKMGHTIAFVRAVAFETDPADPIAAAQAAFVVNPPEGAQPSIRGGASAGP